MRILLYNPDNGVTQNFMPHIWMSLPQALAPPAMKMRHGANLRRFAFLAEIREWPPVLPVFGQLAPFPATPLYARLENGERLSRPKDWR